MSRWFRSVTVFVTMLLASTAYLSAQARTIEPRVADPTSLGFAADRLDRIGELMERRIAAHDIAGAITLVARNGQIVHHQTHGLRDVGSGDPMPTDAVFSLASMTKPITTTAILMLHEEGRLRLDDPVSRFVPEFGQLTVAVPEPTPIPTDPSEVRFRLEPAERPITIRHLLTHTSGIVGAAGTISDREAARVPRQPTETLADYLPRLAVVPLDFQPGTRWQYSPAIGFDLLGRIVEVASGQGFDEFLQERILEPLGMHDTSFNLNEEQMARLARRYEITPAGLNALPLPRPTVYFSGGGGLRGTTGDYLRFAQMLLQGGQLDGRRLLSPRAVQLMRSVYVPDTLPGRLPGEGFGLGVRVITDAAARSTWLSNNSYGWVGAFGTHFWIDPDNQVIAIMMVQTNPPQLRRDFEDAVMQAIVQE